MPASLPSLLYRGSKWPATCQISGPTLLATANTPCWHLKMATLKRQEGSLLGLCPWNKFAHDSAENHSIPNRPGIFNMCTRCPSCKMCRLDCSANLVSKISSRPALLRFSVRQTGMYKS